MLFTVAFVFSLSSFHLQHEHPVAGKTDSCLYTLIIADSLLNKQTTISRFAVSGVKNKLALKFRQDLNLPVGEVVTLNEALFNKIRSQTCGKKYKLKQVNVVDEALLESDAVFMLFFLKKGR